LKTRLDLLSGTQATSPTKNGKPLSPSSTNWNSIPSDAHEKVIFAKS